jgi:hypothetical protein
MAAVENILRNIDLSRASFPLGVVVEQLCDLVNIVQQPGGSGLAELSAVSFLRALVVSRQKISSSNPTDPANMNFTHQTAYYFILM